MNVGDRLPDDSIEIGGKRFVVTDRTFHGTHVSGRIVGLPYDAQRWAEHADRRANGHEKSVGSKRPVGPVVGRPGSDAGGRPGDVDREAVLDHAAALRQTAERPSRSAPGAGDDRPAEGRAGRGEDPQLALGAEDEEEQTLELGPDDDDMNSPAAFRTPPQGSSVGSPDRASEGSTPSGRAGVRETSRSAYRTLVASGRMTAQQLVVAEHFEGRPGLKATRQELARDLGLGINVVCGRVNELLRSEPAVLVERGKKRCGVTGNEVNALELA